MIIWYIIYWSLWWRFKQNVLWIRVNCIHVQGFFLVSWRCYELQTVKDVDWRLKKITVLHDIGPATVNLILTSFDVCSLFPHQLISIMFLVHMYRRGSTRHIVWIFIANSNSATVKDDFYYFLFAVLANPKFSYIFLCFYTSLNRLVLLVSQVGSCRFDLILKRLFCFWKRSKSKYWWEWPYIFVISDILFVN